MHKVSIRTALSVLMLLVTLGALLLYNTVYGNMTSETFSQLDLQLVTQNLTQAKAQLDEWMDSAQATLYYVSQSVLIKPDFAPGRFAAAVDPLVETGNSISSIQLYTRSGAAVCASSAGKSSIFLSSQNPSGEEWFQEALSANGMLFSDARLEHCYRGDYTWVVTLTQPVDYMHDGTPEQGVLAINLRLSGIKEICDAYAAADGGTLMLTSASGAVVYSPYSKLTGLRGVSDVYRTLGIRTQEQQLEISQPLRNEQYILVGLTRRSETARSRQALQRKGALVLTLSLLFSALMASGLAALMARPFRYMEHTMERIEHGVSGVRLQKRGFKEFVNLTVAYNGMIDKIESLMAETEQKQEQLRRMEIASLQEQINPHFLYNTLDSITWLVETSRGKDAVEMIGALAKLLRLSINRGGNFHTVEQEIDHIYNYLIIQKTRYGQRFESHIHVEAGAESLLCPRLILQPIVENAIKHGIGDNIDCQIVVKVFLSGDRLNITVWDDGMGILPEKLKEVQRALRESEPPRPDQINGLALKSVNRRIRLLCGEEYGLSIDSETEEWTCVTIELPAQPSA